MTQNVFEDNQGRKWSCRVTWAAIRRSANAGVDLSKVEEHLGEFYRGSASLVDALWAVCGIGMTDMTRDDFETAIDKTVIDSAREALIAGVEDFFPESRAELIRAGVAEVEKQLADIRNQLRKPSTE